MASRAVRPIAEDFGRRHGITVAVQVIAADLAANAGAATRAGGVRSGEGGAPATDAGAAMGANGVVSSIEGGGPGTDAGAAMRAGGGGGPGTGGGVGAGAAGS